MAAEVIDGDGRRLPRASGSIIDRPAPGNAIGESYDWRRRVIATVSGEALEPRLQAAVEQAIQALASGDYLGAAPKGERALKALESAPDVAPVGLARWLVWLGEVQWRTGALTTAEAHLKRGLAILERTLGTGHPEVAATRNKLALVLQAEGFPGRAESMYQRALSAQEAALGPNHPDVATSMNNLANLYKSQGCYELAEPLYSRALAIREMALGPDHPDVATSLAGLGALYEAEGRHEEAQLYLQPALDIQRKALGGGHPDVADTMERLAQVYGALGQYEQAESLARQVLSIVQDALGPGHPAVADSLAQLAALALARGDAAKAARWAERSLTIREAALGPLHPEVTTSLQLLARVRLAQGRLDDALPLLWRSLSLSEARLRRESLDLPEQRLSMFLRLLRGDEERIYRLARAHPDDPRVQRLALAVALLRSGRSVEEVANTSRAVYRSLRPSDRDTFERLRELRGQLARLSLAGPGSLDAEAFRRQLLELAEEEDALEANLAWKAAHLREPAALPSPDEVVDRVASALPPDGALIHVVTYGERELEPGVRGPNRLRYLALVLAPGGRTGAADLGPAEAVDEAVADLRLAIASRAAEYLGAARAAGALVFDPLKPLLGGARRIYISPDGQLALIPFAALHDGRGFLVDAYDFTYVASGKDLLPGNATAARSRSVVVLADPDLDGGLPENPLPGTRLEAETLQRLFPEADVFLGARATKERLLQVGAPGILHIATHGFFVEDPAGARGARALGAVGPPGGGPPAPSGNPLLRSGLVLAGAEDGLVTALELTGMDLWGTQLVVLSACDTGRGDVKLGQGVYGLRSALRVAGAETVVMSLWKVDDGTTQALMERYYRNLLDGQGRSAALRDAMQALRVTHPHPYYWAPFISSGSDAPLALGEPERVSQN